MPHTEAMSDWIDGGLEQWIAEGLSELESDLAKCAELDRRYPVTES